MRKTIAILTISSTLLLCGCNGAKKVDYEKFHKTATEAAAERVKQTLVKETFDASGYITLEDHNYKFTIKQVYVADNGQLKLDEASSSAEYEDPIITTKASGWLAVESLMVAELVDNSSTWTYYINPMSVKKNNAQVRSYSFNEYGAITKYSVTDGGGKLEFKATYEYAK